MGDKLETSAQRDQTKVSVRVGCTEAEREMWTEEYEELQYPYRTNYLRAMINAGRRDFGLVEEDQSAPERTVTDLKSRVYANLSTQTETSFDELVEIITAQIEKEIEESVQELAAEDKVDIQPRGGIIKTGD